MDYQTFRGSDVHEALFAVRQALGADALIESTRHVDNGHGGVFGRSFVEVVAAPGKSTKAGGASRDRAKPSRFRSTQDKFRGKRSNSVAVEKELAALRNMVDELIAGRPPRERVRAMLYAAGFEGELAKKLGAGATKAARGGRESIRLWLRGRLEERLLVEPGLIRRPFRQMIACVGPTGVGKTTTLAKLAAQAKLELQREVSVISLDTFRVGAVEQWQRYAELIGIDFSVADDAETFHRVVESCPSDLILVDTAGKSAADSVASLRLAQCVKSVGSLRAEVLLVIPAWIRARDAERVRAAYQTPTLSGLVVTKLDEAEQLGGCLHAAIGGQLPLNYLCDGARVPEDIHDAATSAVLDALFPEQA